MSIAYRQNAIDSQCRECGREAMVRCPRCGARLCFDHAPEGELCCPACEEEWEVRRLQVATMGVAGGGASLVLAALAGICVLLVLGVSLMLLTLVALPPWVRTGPLATALTTDVALLALLLRPATWQWVREIALRRVRRRFLTELAT